MPEAKRALITGITGQDGSYLAELLLSKGYQVWGIIRRSSSLNTSRIEHIRRSSPEQESNFQLVYGDLTDSSSLNQILQSVQPHEIYNLAAQSHVKVSFEVPEYTADTTALGALRLLEGMRQLGVKARYYQASSSEMFGQTEADAQKETTPFHPRSPYACSKVFAYWITINYRESYGMFAVNGILFNHESPRRGETFVTRKISMAVARIKAGLQDKLYLGNLDAQRDWGYAGDYVEAMWMMLQQDQPEDYVIGTGETHSVRDFVEEAFTSVGLDWRDYVEIDPRFFRPADVEYLRCDPGKAKRKMGWEPRVKFHELVKMMVEADLEELKAR
ncbi:GDP-mannose 4,6-dehydratase [Desulfoferula mesophila]|uniref:GDP-mannose 4,6-dehydratase n=1 Tax=Desulfoferula mesophila TaxID=3058419 RepID=A0AAU9EH13_9BACT|nr:GDP-mannose 4,6-dehydratase [Desulfoferula mesophilus]